MYAPKVAVINKQIKLGVMHASLSNEKKKHDSTTEFNSNRITSSMHQTRVMRQVYIVSAKQTYGHRFLASMCELNTAKDHKAYYMTTRNCET